MAASKILGQKYQMSAFILFFSDTLERGTELKPCLCLKETLWKSTVFTKPSTDHKEV